MSWLIRSALCMALVLPGARAQSEGQIYRLGVLATGPTAIDTIRAVTLPELAKLGFHEGQNLVVDLRFSHANFMPTVAAQLVEAAPDALIGVGTLAIANLKSATARIPIVMSLGPDDPAAHGFANNLARPKGNITGLIAMSAELDGKRLQLLKEAIPKVRRIATFVPPDVSVDTLVINNFATGVGLEFVGARSAYNRYEYAGALAGLEAAGAEALIIGSAPLFSDDPAELVRLATQAGMPTICEWRGLVERGCLIGYGPSLSELRRRTADYVARILQGTPPSELPIEGPTRFELVINARTARILGIELPLGLLIRADEVIE